MPGDIRISSGLVQAFTIPTESRESDGTASWDSTTIVTVELQAGSHTGIGYAYAHEAAAKVAEYLVQREVLSTDVFSIPETHLRMDRAVRNMGRPGLVSSAISAIDNCLWDLKARVLNLPLLHLLGPARLQVTAYGSGGFTSYSDEQLINQMSNWASEGFSCVKMKIGREPERDVHRIKEVQKALQGKAKLYVDANGAYHPKTALEKSREYGDLGVVWFEEPVSSDDRAGLRFVREHCPAGICVAAGEYAYVPDDFRELIQAHSVDVLQADGTRCGGVSNFLMASDVCEMFHLPLSAHTAPSLHATLCCALSPAMNVEYFFDHYRIEQMIFEGAIPARNGMLTPDLTRPGLGLELKQADAAKFRVCF
jgi:L-alanine-DL-glutamate epimerase-like enolase superfamily enzyme